MLLHYNKLGREGAVLHNMDRSMPSDLNALYETLLSECHRHTASNRQTLVATLLDWISFSLRPLLLAELVSLLRHVTREATLDLEEIPEPFAKFLRVGDPVLEGDTKSAPEYVSDVKELERGDNGGGGAGGSSSPDKNYDDGVLPVKFRERSMRSFFRSGPQAAPSLRTKPSRAHKGIFLECATLARPNPAGGTAPVNVGLQRYATESVISHWMEIDPEDLTEAENVEVMEAFGLLMTNAHNFVAMIEWLGSFELPDDLFGKAAAWAGRPERTSLSPPVQEWWRGVAAEPRGMLVSLGKAHVARLFKAANAQAGLKAYMAARKALDCVSL